MSSFDLKVIKNDEEFDSILNSQENKDNIDLDKLTIELDQLNNCKNTEKSPNENDQEEEESFNYQNEIQLRRIDFVLVYRNMINTKLIRKKFEDNLENEGLVLKRVKSSVGNNVSYVHIYAPFEVLTRYAEVLALRMPMKTIKSNLKLLFDYETMNSEKKPFTTVFSKDKEYLFNVPEHDREDFFSPSQRAEIIDYILRRTRFNEANDIFSLGINKLLADRVYEAAYPLHDEVKSCCKCNQSSCGGKRCDLLSNWAMLGCIFKSQPLESICDYFGVKISMYYAWVGFYTLMLIPVTLVGILTFAYGAFTVSSDPPTEDICSKKFEFQMCPSCSPANTKCQTLPIDEFCVQAKASYIVGNYTTVIFAIFTSIWATIYLEMWKRYSARISYKWDLSDFSAIDEYPRPEYLTYLSKHKKRKTRINPVTHLEEPYISFITGRLPYFIVSFSFVTLSVVLVLLIMVSIIVYRVSVYIAISNKPDYESEFLRKYAEWIVTATAALINLIAIMLLSIVYKNLALWLTELETPRTQNEFDNSLTLKMYLFEFVNYYSSMFYIAFFKGVLRKSPPEGGLLTEKQNYFIEPCPVGGCYFDLCIQLVIIFIGKNIFNSILEYLLPFLQGLYNQYQYLTVNEKTNSNHRLPQYEEDYLLESWDHTVLFYEYLELIIQFGFVTLFVAAFPLAPLFALINNIFEIRLDARKMLMNYKRPVAQRVKDIGIWYYVMDALGKLSVLTNAVLIAFKTDIVPRFVYHYQNGNLFNFYDSTLSVYQITEKDSINGTDYCLYDGYRKPPQYNINSNQNYPYTDDHWHVLVTKIIFVVLFQNVVGMINSFLRVMIPDEPASLRLQKRQHAFLTNELIIRHELKSRKSHFSYNEEHH